MEKSIPFSLEELENLKSTYSTPYYLYDGDGIKTNAENYIYTFKNKFGGFKQFFAVKALPNPSILKLLKDCGMGFDCSSPEEIKIVRFIDNIETTESKSEIFYTSNFTSSEDIAFALDNNCLLNLDDIDGLNNLINSGAQIPSTICFRYNQTINVNPDVKSNNFVGNSSKFGMDYITIIQAYAKAKELGIVNFGLHTMCVSNMLDLKVWKNIILNIFELVNELKQTHSIQIKFINIGGGLGIPYEPNISSIDLDKFVCNLKEYWDWEVANYSIDWNINLFTECGRYITGPYGYLVSSVKSIKKTSTNQIFYGLDSCMANLMRPGMYNSYHHISVPRLANETEQIKANVVGTLCENNDWFCSNRDLPIGIEKEDLIVIHDTGAHSFSMGFNYNSKLKSPELLKFNKNVSLIRFRETIYDLFSNCIVNNIKINEKNNNGDALLLLTIILFVIFCFAIIWIAVFLFM